MNGLPIFCVNVGVPGSYFLRHTQTPAVGAKEVAELNEEKMKSTPDTHCGAEGATGVNGGPVLVPITC